VCFLRCDTAGRRWPKRSFKTWRAIASRRGIIPLDPEAPLDPGAWLDPEAVEAMRELGIEFTHALENPALALDHRGRCATSGISFGTGWSNL
jgi:hypothetical protein